MSMEEIANASWIASRVDGKMQKESKSIEKKTIENKKWQTLFLASKPKILKSIQSSAASKWKEKRAPERAALLRQVSVNLNENKALLADVMAKEMGKPIKEGLRETAYASSFFDWFAGECERVYGLEIPSKDNQKRCFLRYEPIGPTALITPWNFPLAMPARKVAAALAAGCSLILKPSPEVPLSALLLQEACFEAGVPNEAFQVLIGEETLIGKELLGSPLIRKLSFTGSSEVGAKLYSESAKTIKKVTLELGGNAPFIVFEDADLEKAAQNLIVAKFRNTGQTCIAANRILVHESVLKKFIKLFIKELRLLKRGSPFDETTDISLYLHPLSEKKVREQKNEALKKGAECLFQESDFLSPSILYPVNESMAVFREETFGPLVPITSFKTSEDAISKANSGTFGLAAYIFTKDLARAFHISEALHYGIVGINDGLPSASYASFGGTLFSGLGREGGPTGIYEYLTEKYLSISL